MSSNKRQRSSLPKSIEENSTGSKTDNVKRRKSPRFVNNMKADYNPPTSHQKPQTSPNTITQHHHSTSNLKQITTSTNESQTPELNGSENSHQKNAQQTSRPQVACSEEVEGIMKSSIEDIEQNNEDLTDIYRPAIGRKLENLVKITAEFTQEFNEEQEFARKSVDYFNPFVNKRICVLERQHLNKVVSQIQPSSLADFAFYHLMKEEESRQEARLNTEQSTQFYHSQSWYELCSFMFCSLTFENKFYERLGKNPAALEHLIHKHPQLLFNQWGSHVEHTLIKYLPFERLHHVMMTVRNESSQTHLYYNNHRNTGTLTKHYQLHTDELYQLLSLQDNKGQTALHVNTILITDLIILTYTPKYRDALLKLTSIRDKNNKTFHQTAEGWIRGNLSWLIDQTQNNRYILYYKPNVLIIYNTRDRPGAEEEARTIYDAFNSTQRFNTKLEQDKNEQDIIQLIEDSANEEQYNRTQAALIVVLLSHGKIGVINDEAGRAIKLPYIESVMCQKKLQGRPKILITQCCQHKDVVNRSQDAGVSTQNIDAGVANASIPYAPTNADFCAIMSNVSGEPSERGLFIPKLAEQIKNCQVDESILQLVAKVSQQIAAENKPQKPIIQSTLKGEFCLMNHDIMK